MENVISQNLSQDTICTNPIRNFNLNKTLLQFYHPFINDLSQEGIKLV